tara:strand:- start:4438 stop:4908 length:471 start_codon:yes stop_codon:yes gene_type:complete
MCWFAAYTKSRSEFKALDYFNKCKVNAYVPEYLEKRGWSDRVKKARVPAISSYVFFELKTLNYDLVNLNPFVKNVVKAFGKPVKICDSEITELKNCLKNYTENIEVTSGDSVSIESGLFKNKKGIIDEINGNSVTLLINSIKVKLSMSSSKLVLAS